MRRTYKGNTPCRKGGQHKPRPHGMAAPEPALSVALWVELDGERLNCGRRPGLYYMRDKNGVEADLAVEAHRRLRLFEIKSARTPDASMLGNLRRLGRLSDSLDVGAVVYAGEDWSVDGVPFVHFAETARLVAGAD